MMMTMTMKEATETVKKGRSSIAKHWTVILISLWIAIIGSSMYERYRPVSDWFVPQSILIEDAKLGENPVMHYTRTIKQPFFGTWVSELQARQDNGRWSTTCAATGRSLYDPDKDLPNKLTLKWWTAPVDCTPTDVGTYRLVTVWEIRLPNGLTKQTSEISNTFKVTEPRPENKS